MFTDEQAREIRAIGGFSYDIAKHEVAEVINTAAETGAFTDRVSAWEPQGEAGLRLQLNLSDEVHLVSGPLDHQMFINPDPHGLKLENITHVLDRAYEVLEELFKAAVYGSQPDWRHTRIVGDGA